MTRKGSLDEDTEIAAMPAADTAAARQVLDIVAEELECRAGQLQRLHAALAAPGSQLATEARELAERQAEDYGRHWTAPAGPSGPARLALAILGRELADLAGHLTALQDTLATPGGHAAELAGLLHARYR